MTPTLPAPDGIPHPDPRESPSGDPEFRNSLETHIFPFTYEGEARALRGYLLERYRHGRDAAWAESFYPARVRLNGERVDAATGVRPGDRVTYLHRRDEEPPAPPPPAVLHEDPHLLALLKSDNVPVNPSGIYYFTCLAISAREHFEDPGLTPLHRLDLETSGPVLFGRQRKHLGRWHKLFMGGGLQKRYKALVYGAFPEDLKEIAGWIVPDPRSAIHTRLRLLPSAGDDGSPPEEAGDRQLSLTRIHRVRHVDLGPGGLVTELEVEPVTGKTNQIRVALAHVGHPIVGDKKYHRDEGVFLDWIEHRDFERLRGELRLPRQALHCASLAFDHPFTGEPVRIQAPEDAWAAKVGELTG